MIAAAADPLTPLTSRQRQVLDATVELTCRYGVPPSIRDLMDALDVRSTHGIVALLDPLVRRGLLLPPDPHGSGARERTRLTPLALRLYRSVHRRGDQIVLRTLAPEVTLSLAEAERLALDLLAATRAEGVTP